MTHLVTTQWKKNVQFESDNPSGKTVLIDLGADNGGKGDGLRPKALMLTALAGCSGVDITPMLEKMKVEIDDFKIVIEGHLTEEHPKYYHLVTVDYHFYGTDLNEVKIKRAVDLSVDKYCGVMEMFRRFADVKVRSHYHNN
ncbi:OsmC family protein [Formosa sp. L2A11]|uniref:OsmC family protein n=1 Tax=Formosa sp. L2A11 TaxID=2686363 RepID=UPI00131D821F|nr:OsmC family protein [Formosa sp. L2A11]